MNGAAQSMDSGGGGSDGRCDGGTIAVGDGNIGDGAMEGETAAG